MYKIVSKKQLSEQVFEMTFLAPHIAQQRKAGQFIIIQTGGEYGERIPLTIADANADEGTVKIIYQTVGESTIRMSKYEVGEYFDNVLGPLGNPTHVPKKQRVICVGGGIGVAPLHPIAQAVKAAGNEIKIIMGARNKELVVMEEDMRKISDDLIICTDDGSYGIKDLVTGPLKELCETWNPTHVIAIGPPIMMKFCVKTVEPFKDVDVLVSLNSIMIDGTGMCGCCRVQIGNETKFVCVDGPEFDGRLVDWGNMALRLGTYKEIEKKKCDNCRIGLH